MFITNNKFFLGAAVGVGAAATGYVIYKKNQDKIDGFLRDQGFNIPCSQKVPYDDMTLEELVLSKERLEDLIAEREVATD